MERQARDNGDDGAPSPLSAASSSSPPPSSSAAAALAARIAPGNIRSLILEKEKELHDINEYRIRTLEALLRDKEAAVHAYKQKFVKLQEDFKYNLKLLEGRDEELALYDANFASLKGVLRDREAEASELKAQAAELQAELNQEQQRGREQEVFFQQKLKDARAQMEGARWKFDDELRRQQDELEQARRKMDRQLREKDEDVETERREVSVTFDEVMRRREVEFKQALDDLQTKNRELELKLKSTQRENDVQGARLDELKGKLETAQQLLQDNEKETKSLEWELADVRGAKDAKIAELEKDIANLQEVKQSLLDEYESKMAELLQSLHSVEKAFVQQKKQFDGELQRQLARKDQEAQTSQAKVDARISTLSGKLRDAEEQIDSLQAELKQTKWERDDQLLEKDREIEKIKSAMQDLDDQKQAMIGELKQQLWTQDREAATLQEKLKDAVTQLQIQKEKDKVQRQELLDSIEKQEDLRREVLAVNLRWENKLQDEQQELEGRYDLRIREVQQTKDRLFVEKQAIEERLVHAENELQRARSEMRTMKSNARLNETFGSPYYAAPSSKNDNTNRHGSPDRPVDAKEDVGRSVDGSLPAPSPLWSDDLGSISPGAVITPLVMTESPVTREARASVRSAPSTGKNAGAAASSALQDENAKLREMIRHMKEAISEQAQEMEQPTADTAMLETRLEESEQRCSELERQLLQQMNSNVSASKATSGNDTINQRLDACERELAEARQSVEEKTKQIAELETELAQFKTQATSTDLQSKYTLLETQNADLKRKLAAANSDIDRLVRERGQLMELSNQLRSDLRKLTDGSAVASSRPDFSGKKDYENLVAELTRSLEEARVHNKTLKRELRRMVKLQIQQQQQAESSELADKASARDSSRLKRSEMSTSSHASSEDATPRRHSSTLSMMKIIDDSPPSARRRTSGRSNASNGSEYDEELLTLVRTKRSSASESAVLRNPSVTSSRGGSAASSTPRPDRGARVPPSIPEDVQELEHDGDEQKPARPRVSVDGSAAARPEASTLSTLFRRESERENSFLDQPSGQSKVSDARLRLQQAKEMLMLSGKQAARTASLASFVAGGQPSSTAAVPSRSSDRETPSQRDAIKKMKELQSKRAEMVQERKKVRNYSLTS